MVLRLLKNNNAYHFILIPLIALALWVRSLVLPDLFPFSEGENGMPLYAPLYRLLSASPFISNLLAVCLVILLSFMILRINTLYGFIRLRTFLPSNIFILIVGGLVSLHTLHPVYFGTLFLLLSIDRIFSSYDSGPVYSNAFDSGFFIGLGSLFYFNLIFYFPVTLIGFLLMRKSSEWRNFALPLVGVVLPWLFAFSYYFFNDSLKEFITVIAQNITTPDSFRHNINHQIYLAFLTILTLWSGFILLVRYEAKKISTRNYFKIFILIFAISLTLFIIVPAVSHEIMVIMAVPLTFLISNYLIFIRSPFWGNLLIMIFLALIIYMQF